MQFHVKVGFLRYSVSSFLKGTTDAETILFADALLVFCVKAFRDPPLRTRVVLALFVLLFLLY